jgi:hypothetical protein
VDLNASSPESKAALDYLFEVCPKTGKTDPRQSAVRHPEITIVQSELDHEEIHPVCLNVKCHSL